MKNIQERILYEIDRRGGSTSSLLALADELGIDYSNAYERVHDLARRGHLTIARPGRNLVLTLNFPNLQGRCK